jgi:tRNA A37 threonylcarbamoyladenosine dehydratase
MINLFKRTKTETIQPCGVNRMVMDKQVSFNDVFKSAHKELNKTFKLKLNKNEKKRI